MTCDCRTYDPGPRGRTRRAARRKAWPSAPGRCSGCHRPWRGGGQQDRWGKAVGHYDEAIRLDPTFAPAFRARALAWWAKGDTAKALGDLTEAVRLDPRDSRALGIRAVLFSHKGEVDKALADAEGAIRLDPKYAVPYQTRASLRVHRGKLDEAMKDANEAVRLDPGNAQVYTTRAGVWAAAGDLSKAVEDMSQAVRLSPKDAKLYVSRAACQRAVKAWGGVLNDLDEAVRLDPENAAAWSDRAWLRATCPDGKVRDGKKAVADATHACRLSSWRDGNHLTALAAAYAESGEFTEAVKFARLSMEFPAGGPDWTDRARNRLKLYEGKQPYRTGE